MPQVVSPRKIRLLSPDSSTFTVLGNTPTEIPIQFLEYAVKNGCAVVAAAADDKPSAPKYTVEEAMAFVIERGDPEDFNVNGMPKPIVIKSLVGHAVSAREIAQRWAAMDGAPKTEPAE